MTQLCVSCCLFPALPILPSNCKKSVSYPEEERGCPVNTWSYYMCKFGFFGVLKCRGRYNLHLSREEMKVKQRVYIKAELF